MENPSFSNEKINQQFDQQFNNQGGKVPIPNGTAVLVLGIISIAGCLTYGIPGLICGIIALVKAGKSRALMLQDADRYTPASLRNLKSGRICATIGVILSSLMVLGLIIFFVALATSARHPYRY